jgi:nicotinate-nucleotide adenylyltransferase
VTGSSWRSVEPMSCLVPLGWQDRQDIRCPSSFDMAKWSNTNHPMRKSLLASFGSIRVKAPLAGAGQRIGIMGGTFNPPHRAHRIIAQVAIKRLGLDRLWWLVTPGNPLKSRDDLLALEDRMRLARSMANDRRIIVSALERDLPSSFTAATLAHLALRHRGVQFVWVMGADCLANFHSWQQWRDIFRIMPVAVVDRPGWRLKALASPAAHAFRSRRIREDKSRCLPGSDPPAWTMLTGPLLAISSTAIRARAAGKPSTGQTASTMTQGQGTSGS